MTSIEYRRAIIELVAQLFPAEDHDRWMLTPHSALDGDWPTLAMQKGNEEAVYRLLLRMKQGTEMNIISAVLVGLLLPAVALADFSGRVVGVSDGDTIKVMHNGKAEKIRLHGIDWPEKAQPFGSKAKQFTSAMVFGKMVRVLIHGRDRYGRTVAEVILPDGGNVNQALVKVGLAWWYRQYAPHDDTLRML